MDWATAAATVSDSPQWRGRLDPLVAGDDDFDFWGEVEALVNGDVQESVYLEESVAPTKVHYSVWVARLHPRDRWGKWIQKLDGFVGEIHAGQVDRRGMDYADHARAVADSVHPEAAGVALVHGALEHTDATEDDLKALTDDKGKRLLDDDDIVAVKLLTKSDADSYEDYIDKIATAPGKPGELAREVKRADIQHNVGRMTDESDPSDQRDRYEQALHRLRRPDEPIEQRGYAKNVANEDPVEVERRLRSLYDTAHQAGHDKDDRDWYQDMHDLLSAVAEENGIDPTVFSGMVAVTSPRTRWCWDDVTGMQANLDHFHEDPGRYPNLRNALRAVKIARDHPDELALAIKKLKNPGMTTDNLMKAVRIYRGEDPDKVMNAPKTRSFFNNLALPDRETTTTIDTLMVRACLGNTSRAGYHESADALLENEGGYLWIVERMDNVRQQLADEGIHLKPQELQAIIWREQQRRQDANVEAESARRKGAAAKAVATRASNRK